LIHGKLPKSKVVINLRQIGSPRGSVRIEQLPATVYGAVVVELYRLLHVQHCIHGPIDALQADCVVEIGGGIERIERLGDGKRSGAARSAFFLKVALAKIEPSQRVG